MVLGVLGVPCWYDEGGDDAGCHEDAGGRVGHEDLWKQLAPKTRPKQGQPLRSLRQQSHSPDSVLSAWSDEAWSFVDRVSRSDSANR